MERHEGGDIIKPPQRVQRRLWGRRRNGGWVLPTAELLKALKDGEVVEFDRIQVGTRTLRKLIELMTFPDLELLVTSNGHLQLENMVRQTVQKDEQLTNVFRLPRNRHMVRVYSGAWEPKTVNTVVVIRPRRY